MQRRITPKPPPTPPLSPPPQTARPYRNPFSSALFSTPLTRISSVELSPGSQGAMNRKISSKISSFLSIN